MLQTKSGRSNVVDDKYNVSPKSPPFLTRAACLSRGPYVLLASISFFFIIFNDPLSKAISGSTEPISTKFSPYRRYMIVDYRSDPILPMAQGTLPCQTWQNRTIRLYS